MLGAKMSEQSLNDDLKTVFCDGCKKTAMLEQSKINVMNKAYGGYLCDDCLSRIEYW